MYFFTTIEFYVVAIAIALVLIAFFSKSHNEASKYTYIYQGDIKFAADANADKGEYISITSLDNGTVEVIHHNVILPLDSSVNIRVDVCGEKVVCAEKMVENIPDPQVFLYDVKFTLSCLHHLSYNIEYECVYNGKWCKLDFINNCVSEVYKELKL